MPAALRMRIGVYIHVPFCRAKCDYCSFVSVPIEKTMAERYRLAVVHELECFRGNDDAAYKVDSVYFGGGTPSLLPAADIAAILEVCRKRFVVLPDCEISLEANPGTLAQEKLALYRSIGVNRISLGSQSFSDRELAEIGRIHTAKQNFESVDLLRAGGFQDVSLDLILGLPWQTESQWRTNLDVAANLKPTHISVYMLEEDRKTPLYKRVARGLVRLPDEDAVADWYLQTIDFLASRGYPQYEISNFALPGCECQHNLKYWRREPVLAFGVAAHSFDGSSRYANVASLSSYLRRVEAGRTAVEWCEPLTSEQCLAETMFLGLRLNQGLDWREIRRAHETERIADCESSLRDMSALGLLAWEGSVVRLTRRGMLLSNEVFQRFVQ
jgi:oxygen-independent coproporphyrinogen-3 oxidase